MENVSKSKSDKVAALRELFEKQDTMNYYSFDVFDTCLCRLCGEPRLLFDVLSIRLQEVMGESCNEQLRQLFVATRSEATGRDLQEIYNNVSHCFPLPFPPGRMAEMEIEVERLMLAPIQKTLQLVNRLRGKGAIFFISDMYLPSSFIQERLVEHGFFQEGDRLYVSDELGAWKHDGSLYRLVHEKENLSYRRWHHYGDNRHSDYVIPRRLGIHAHMLQYGYLPYETNWRELPALRYQSPAILAGVARAVRLSSEAHEDQKAFVCDISAPLMVSWVGSVLRDSVSRGVKRVYFCARDTHTSYLIARQLQSVFPEVSVNYLFVSRNALQTDEENVFRYFSEVGLASSEKVAVVDSNSSGNSLRVINQMMVKHGCNPVLGYFLSSFISSNDPHYTHPSIYPSYVKAIGNKKTRLLTGVKIFLELVFSLNYHQKTLGYEFHGKVVRPILGNDVEDLWCFKNVSNREAKKWNDQLAIHFSKAFALVELPSHCEQLFENVAIPTLTEFIDAPRKEYLHYLRNFVWEGRPLIGFMVGKRKGVWNRGNYYFSLPRWVLVLLKKRFV